MEQTEKIIDRLKEEFHILRWQVENTVSLIDEGNTIPFIARYRKERTGSLNDEVLRELFDRLVYLRSLEEKKAEITRLIDEQGKLDSTLLESIENALTLSELEDIYRPYRPKRRTRATIAKEKGLLPLAELILEQHPEIDPKLGAQKYISEEVLSVDEALCGAMDIIAEQISDNADFRKALRTMTLNNAVISSHAATDEDSVYAQYYDFSENLGKIAGYKILAINRGEKEGFLKVSIDEDESAPIEYLIKHTLKTPPTPSGEYVRLAAEDSYRRLIAPSVWTEARNIMTEAAQEVSIKVFNKNLRGLLLQPPIKGRVVLGLDPGYRTGCKIAVVDETGKVLDTGIVYCTLPNHDREKAKKQLKELILKHNVNVISIGNGTASKESEILVSELIAELGRPVSYAMTNEAGASVYSASKLAAEEFPDYDVALRSAVSIARRLQDPLAELVKIDPKSIGVGQYQHDMNQKRLGEALSGVVEDCVNSVGVDLNTASPSLLSYVAGINKTIAKNITSYREENGKFHSRKELLKVPKLGNKTFEQCAGFLRVPESDSVLDNTSVHPESYKAALELLDILGYSEKDVAEGKISDIKKRLGTHNVKRLCEDLDIGAITVIDIADSLLKKGRDPRDELPKPVLRSDILSMEDLEPGMVLTGTVRNVIDFGAFVDIGVHQDGLVHISQICQKFIQHPSQALSVGDIVKVKVLDVDIKKKRISLSIKEAQQ